MALSDAIQNLAYARFLEPFQQENLWLNFVQDFSAEFPGYGNSLVLPTDSGAKQSTAPDPTSVGYVPADRSSTYTPDSTAEQNKWADPSVTGLQTVTLTIDQVRDVSKQISYISERRIRPSLIESAARHSAREMMEAINADIRDELLTAQNAEGPTQRTALSATAAQFGAAADTQVLTPLLNELANAQLAADVAFWPNDGRVCVVSPRIHKYITDKLQAEKLYLVNENPQFAVEGMTVRYKGWEIVKDNSRGDGVTANDDNRHFLAYLRRGVGVGYAGELSMFRTFESEIYRSMVIHGLFSWGVKVIEPEKVLVTQFNIT